MQAVDQWALSRLFEVMRSVKDHYDQYEFAKVYKCLYAFCNEDLSSFYLDILKDRLYTSPSNSPERRSAQTVLYQILSHLVRAIAPIFCFTAEEIFMEMPRGTDTVSVPSVHILPWLDCPSEWDNAQVREKFAPLVALRPHVLKALEEKRRDGKIGSALEAKIVFRTASEKDWKYLSGSKGMLPAAFIVSQVEIEKVGKIDRGLSDAYAQTEITILKADGVKCSRCWNYRIDVGKDVEHQTLCARCTVIVKEFN